MTDNPNRDFSGAVNQSPGMNEREGLIERAINEIVQRVSEWDDRTSPEDWPEALLITADELRDELRGFASVLAPAPSAWQPIETARLDGKPFLARYQWLGEDRFMVIRRSSQGPWWILDGDGHLVGDRKSAIKFTHWAPLQSFALPSSDRGGVG